MHLVGEAQVAQQEKYGLIKPARIQDVASIPLAVLIPDGAHAPPLAYHAPVKSHASVGESDKFNAESRGPALPRGPIEIVRYLAIIGQRCAIGGTNLLLRFIECTF